MTSTDTHEAELTRDAGIEPEEKEPMPQGRNIVTVIGINKYQEGWRELNNAVSDAQGIRKLFVETFGFIEPVPHLFDGDATKGAIIRLVEDQLRQILQPDDALILFFAGHGHTRVDKVGKSEIETGFIVPVEARRDQWGDYIKMNDWLEAVSTLPARHIVVILDACHSGFGVGQAMQIFRDAVRYEQDLVGRVSRKVFTSAQRDQLAQDSGPVAGHSLFTGTLIDGLNWGKADLDSNKLITGSELSLYVQQQVGQYSKSKQTPDFGTFGLDDRGEIVIKLGNNSFDGVKAQAFAALQRAEMDRFSELVKQVTELRPDSPETLYLQYRLAFYDGNLNEAVKLAEQLYDMQLTQGIIPLSGDDLWQIKIQLPYWQNVLSIPPEDSPLEIQVLMGKNKDEIKPVTVQPVGTISGYPCEIGLSYQFNVTNSAETPVYVYIVQIGITGRLEFIPPWRATTTPLSPGATRLSYPFQNVGQPGLFEMRFLSSPVEIPELLSPPSPNARAVLIQNEIPVQELAQIRMKAIHFLKILPSPGMEPN